MKRILPIFLTCTLFVCGPIWAASDIATAQATVITAISITNISVLDFGTAPGGDIAKTVAPGTIESATNGSFNVAGQASTSYQISLPANGTVTMTTGGGGAFRTIAVNNFTSFPATTGVLSAGGTQLLLVGATRAALSPSQVAGSYSGSYTVTVVY